MPEPVGGDWSCRSAHPGRCVRVRVRNAASVAGERSRLPAGRLDPAPIGGQPNAGRRRKITKRGILKALFVAFVFLVTFVMRIVNRARDAFGGLHDARTGDDEFLAGEHIHAAALHGGNAR